MSSVKPLIDHLAPDCIARLERAAVQRFDEAEGLLPQKRFLAALYLFGFSVEMCLTAAYFRSVGVKPNTPIHRDTRRIHMGKARQQQVDGQYLMDHDPHSLVGWARFLQWQRQASPSLTKPCAQRLKEAVHQAETVYKHWRPELRYKTVEVNKTQLDETHRAAAWFIEQQGRL